ncbi:PRTRC system ThiF family protein [Crenobacter sp. SG2305]|uniref:PRTRC system ThiF family protein n=1 Tax=Crenobacter oryzisoli TaxID=3056844 RepID=UPI0025AB0631|nr:PRTRC system ThiF family protein [Crenobacter sp. SG2305]MDN0082345.1 PRTRC system ThiF family protein [Crenobacter sp. SG2305]
MQHTIDYRLLSKTVKVILVGAGGTGSQVLTGLARLDRALRALEHPGLDVVVFDDDTVSDANVGRQLFYPCDVGHSKAEVLVTRVNAAFGIGFKAFHARFDKNTAPLRQHGESCIVIGAVDTRKSRQEILAFTQRHYVDYWLDIGNRAGDGQIVLGQPLREGEKNWHMRLPLVTELFPSVLEEDQPEDDLPSCSLAEALERQSLFINQAMATHALQLLWQMFRTGVIDHSAIFVNLDTGRVNPLPIDREAWLRFGHRTHRKPPTRKPR